MAYKTKGRRQSGNVIDLRKTTKKKGTASKAGKKATTAKKTAKKSLKAPAKETTLNAYQAYWAVLKPKKGIATKIDSAKTGFMAVGGSNAFLLDFAPNLNRAKEKVNKIKGKLSKEYSVFFITDKQFGMIKTKYENGKVLFVKSPLDFATTNQKREMYSIK